MKGNKFKRYAYFARLELSDLLKLSKTEYTVNRIIDDICDTFSIEFNINLTLGEVVQFVFLPVRIPLLVIACPLRMHKWNKIARELTEVEINNLHITGICLYTIDWKKRFGRSKPVSWNDY